MSLYAHIHGHLTSSPKIVKVGDTTVCKFRVASNRRFRDKEGKVYERTDFLDVDAWAGRGEVIQKHFTEGSEFEGHGFLEYQPWEDKDTHEKRSKHCLRLEHFEFCGGTRREENAEDVPHAADAEAVG